MDELRFHFSSFQFVVFAAWGILNLILLRTRTLTTKLGMTCLISVTFMIVYLCLIAFGILGAGYSPGLILPSYDAYIKPFLLFLFGIPVVIFVILLLFVLDALRIRRLQAIKSAYVATSIYLLWVTLMANVNVIASI